MADNLAVGISVDTAKAKADLKLFNAEIANTTKALKDAVKAGDATGQAAQHQQLIGLYQQQATAQVKVTAAKKADTAATIEATQAHRGYAASLRETGLELGHLAHAAGLPIEGLRALRSGFIAFAAVEVFRGITSAITKITDLSEAAAKAGTTVERLKSLQSAMRATGQNADDAAPLMAKFSAVLRESRLTPVFDPKGPFESLMGTSALAYRPGAEGDARAARDAARRMLELRAQGRIDDANKAAQENFGQTVDQNLELIQRIANDALPKVAAATKEEIALQKEYNQEVANAVDQWDKVTEAIGRAGMAATVSTLAGKPNVAGAYAAAPQAGMATGGYVGGSGSGLARVSNGEFVVNAGSVGRLGVGYLQGLNRFAEGGLVGGDGGAITTEEHNKQLREIANGMAKAFTDAWEGVQRVSRSLEEALVQVSKGLLKLGDPESGQRDDPRQAVTHAAHYGGVTYGAATYEGARYEAAHYGAEYMGGNATGGLIRGAGSGTSDSILARLSNGEFVINAGATRRLGTSFLNGLNSFAAGGLVNVPPIRFAEGGLVPSFAGGGPAMASFHFESGNSFRLGGPVDVVNAMVTEAHAQQVRSAGVKPSWYAARPSGR